MINENILAKHIGTGTTIEDLYKIFEIKNNINPKLNRPDLELREIKRSCNKMVKQGKLVDLTGGLGNKNGVYSLPLKKPRRRK